MIKWTEDEIQRVRYGVFKRAEDELIKKNLNQEQLQAIFHILAFGAPVSYKPNEPGDYFGYGGAGWFIEDHF